VSYALSNLPGEVIANPQGNYLAPIPFSEAQDFMAKLAFLRNI